VSQGEWDKFQIRVDVSGLAAGLHEGYVDISAQEIVDSPVSIWVVLNIEE
jgi:hypothetical protein